MSYDVFSRMIKINIDYSKKQLHAFVSKQCSHFPDWRHGSEKPAVQRAIDPCHPGQIGGGQAPAEGVIQYTLEVL